MRKLMATMIATMIGTMSAGIFVSMDARAEDKSDGCGLGWQITKKTSFLATTTRTTTNAFVPPTFGMTSGTIGCSPHSFAKKDQSGVTYAMTNFDPLTLEMAQGGGEFLDGFARSMGCGDAVTGAFGRMTQQKYRAIVRDGKVTPVEMFQNVKDQIRKDPVLASSCNA